MQIALELAGFLGRQTVEGPARLNRARWRLRREPWERKIQSAKASCVGAPWAEISVYLAEGAAGHNACFAVNGLDDSCKSDFFGDARGHKESAVTLGLLNTERCHLFSKKD